ncbi:MAG: cytidine deaminase [Bacteroidetes bacterium]|nr:cytidine deaminase [Bacteroidota bacterium]
MKEYKFSYLELENDNELGQQDKLLLSKAREVTSHAYAPYSNFFVGSAALLSNKKIITATNQENASFPVGICAERVLLSAISSLYDNVAIDTIAISYNNKKSSKSDHPVAPCGICRQSLIEFENRFNHPIRLLLSGMEGKVIIIESASQLLPFHFSSKDM